MGPPPPPPRSAQGRRSPALEEVLFQQVLKLDAGRGAFSGANTTAEVSDAAPDYDLYLMEKGLVPLLLQGLDALSKHVDKMNAGKTLSGASKVPFNPLTWLAQYLLRNHPSNVKDHRARLYSRLAELASVERGRRGLLRRREEMEEYWLELASENEMMGIEDVLDFLKRLDVRWNLSGEFSSKFDISMLRESQLTSLNPEAPIMFSDLWDWFEGHVKQSDILRPEAFEIAAQRREEVERLQHKEERERQEQALQEVLESRRSREEMFGSLSADFFTNDVIMQILNKGAIIDSVEEHEGSAPLKGDHIQLIISVLDLWGYPTDDVSEEPAWSYAAMDAFKDWALAHAPKDAALRIDAVTLELLMNREEFRAHLAETYPLPEMDALEGRLLEVQRILGDDGHGDDEELDLFVEAVDEEMGERQQLVLPQCYVAEVRERLADPDGPPLLARIDIVSQRITFLLPPPTA